MLSQNFILSSLQLKIKKVSSTVRAVDEIQLSLQKFVSLQKQIITNNYKSEFDRKGGQSVLDPKGI